jgi:hypothetical protein
VAVDAFSFVFSLFGLLLGLALAEVLGGLGRALQSRRKIHIGWLSPLLGAIVAFDLTSFWAVAWNVHERIPARIFVLFAGLVLTGTYYLVARLTFPDDRAEWPDYDAYYFAHKPLVVGGVIACNLFAQLAEAALGFDPLPLTAWAITTSGMFYLSFAALLFVKSKRANLLMLAFILAQYPLVSFLELWRHA